MRSMKVLLVATLLALAALLVTDVVDLCHVTPDGEIVFAPGVETSAFRRWGHKLGDALFPAEPAHAAPR